MTSNAHLRADYPLYSHRGGSPWFLAVTFFLHLRRKKNTGPGYLPAPPHIHYLHVEPRAPELETLARNVQYPPLLRHLRGLPTIHFLLRRCLKFSIPLLPFSYTRHFAFSALELDVLFATGFGLL